MKRGREIERERESGKREIENETKKKRTLEKRREEKLRKQGEPFPGCHYVQRGPR